jgi:spermidine/putrescine transport system substrate-binding protein
MRLILRRAAMIVFWIGLIFSVLYFPSYSFFPGEENSINVFAWGDILEPSLIAEFEKETGIKVRLNYYASNEELIVKLKATGGQGYDLIVPSDYSVPILSAEGLLKELDRTATASAFAAVNPSLLDHRYDPHNKFSIPFAWEIFVLGIDKQFFEGRDWTPSWKMIFDPSVIDYRIAMLNDPVEAFLIASFYLYGDKEPISSEEFEKVIQLLIQQKEWVTAYADFRADYFLASKNCPVVLSSSSYIWRTMDRFDFVGFAIPKEGTFLSVENLCIPAASKKEKLTYQLIDFLYRPSSMATQTSNYGFFPATTNALPLLDVDEATRELIASSPDRFKDFRFTRVIASQEAIRSGWVQVKSSRE